MWGPHYFQINEVRRASPGSCWLEFWKSGPTIQTHPGPDCSRRQVPAPGVYQGRQLCNLCHPLEHSHLVEPTEMHGLKWEYIQVTEIWVDFLEHWFQLSQSIQLLSMPNNSFWVCASLCLHQPHLRFVDFTRTDFDWTDYLYVKVCVLISLKKFPICFPWAGAVISLLIPLASCLAH